MSIEQPNVVLMVDDKKRDLMVSTMIAHALEQRGVTCHLEPLEAYRAVLEAYRPDMMIFNTLSASHLAKYSQRISKMGVLTAVLLNEGLCYDDEERLYNAGKHHTGAHVDYFFSWNQPMKESLEQAGFKDKTHIEVTGPPRFDTYFKPWSNLFTRNTPANGKTKVLLCTNFGLAKFRELAPKRVDQFFEPWSTRIPLYKDYWSIVNSHYDRATRDIFKYLEPLLRSEKFNITLRPHPREKSSHYWKWIHSMDAQLQKNIQVGNESNITQAILDCDVHLHCETCTTAMEAWLAGKPNVELIFDKHPVLYHDFFAKLNPTCDNPNQLISIIEHQLANPRQEKYQEGRKAHLAKWCADPKGDSIYKIADTIAQALQKQPEKDWSRINPQDRRRALKLKLAQKFGQAYHYQPSHYLKRYFDRSKYGEKISIYQKSIRPGDVVKMRKFLKERIASTP